MTADGEPIADLRRRIYGPHATDEDRRRYLEASAAGTPRGTAPEQAAVDEADDAAPPRRPAAAALVRRRAVLLAGGGAVVAAAVAAAAALLRPQAPSGPPPQVLPTTAEDRATLADDLRRGTDAGIAAFLVTHSVLPELRTAAIHAAVERRGIGSGEVVLLQDGGDAGATVLDAETGRVTVPAAGRVTVLLVLAGAGDTGWALETGTARRVVARRGGFQATGALTSAMLSYAAGARPDRLRVEAPSGVPWGAAALFTD